MVYTKEQCRSRKTRTMGVSMQGIDRSKGKGLSLKSKAKKMKQQSPFMKLISKIFKRKV